MYKTKHINERLKMLLLKKKPTLSAFKNFMLIIYLLYYRYTVELGISTLNMPETIIMNSFMEILAYTIITRAYLFIATHIVSFIKMLIAFREFYKNYTKELSRETYS